MAQDNQAQDHQAEDHQAQSAGGPDGGAHDAGIPDETRAPTEGVAAEEEAPAVSLMGTMAPPRAKSVIEAEAIRTGETAPEASSEAAQGPGEHAPEPHLESESDTEALPETRLAEAAETPSAAPSAQEPFHDSSEEPSQAPQRRASLWPVAAAVVVGAGIAVGGAYGLHRLDRSGESIAALQTRVGALEQGNATLASLQANVTTLGQRLDALESKSQATATTLAEQQKALQALQEAVKQAPQAGAAPAGATPSETAAVDLGPLTGRVEKLEQQLAALDQRISAMATKFESDLRAAQAQKDEAAQAVMTHAEADARAILASTLRRKVEAGEAYADELAALAARGADKTKLDALAPFGATGVATPAALQKQFAAVTPDILATRSEPKAEGFFARIVQDAKHLVRIHKVGDTQGTDISAQVARVEAALAGGHLDAALHEWDGMPVPAKAKLQGFAEALRHRIAAIDAAKAIEADALAALAKAKS